MHKSSMPGRSSRRLARSLFWVLILALVLYVAYGGWQTYQHLSLLRTHLAGLRASLNSPGSVGSHLVQLRGDVAALRRDLWLPLALAPHLGWLPGIGPTVQAAPKLFTSGELLLGAVVTTWQALGEPMSTALKGTTDVEKTVATLSGQIRAHAIELSETAAQVHEASKLLSTIEAKRLLSPLVEPVAQVQAVAPLLTAAFDGLTLLPRLIERPGEGTYLLLAQNNDELRPTGGFISSIGAITVRRGVPYWASLEDSYAVEDWNKAHADPPEPLRRYMGLDLWVTRDGNWWPDFPTSAKAVADLYTLNQGGRVDGVIAADMAAAARFVEALAPLELPGKQRLEKGRVLEAFRESWSLPSGSLVTQGVIITVTRPFTGVEITLSYSNKEGRAWFDSLEVMDLERPGANLVDNPSFEEDTDEDGLPDGWQAIGLTETDRLVTDYAHAGAKSLLIVGSPQERKVVLQRTAISGKAGARFRISAQSRSEDTDTKGGLYALTVSFLDAKGRSQSVVAAFPVLTHDWATAGSAEILGRWWTHRKDFMDQFLAAALNKLLARPEEIHWPELLTTIRNLLDERHIQIYMTEPALQSLIQHYGWSGALAETKGDYLAVIDSNLGYNKVTANIAQSIAYDVALDTNGQARSKLTLHYRNQSTVADARCDKFRQYVPIYDALTQGCYWDYVRIYVPAGARLLSAEGGDEPITTTVELSRTCFATYFVLKPGEERELRLEYALPEGMLRDETYSFYAQKQAGTGAIPITITLATPGKLTILEGNIAPAERAVGQVTYRTDLLVDRRVVVRVQP